MENTREHAPSCGVQLLAGSHHYGAYGVMAAPTYTRIYRPTPLISPTRFLLPVRTKSRRLKYSPNFSIKHLCKYAQEHDETSRFHTRVQSKQCNTRDTIGISRGMGLSIGLTSAPYEPVNSNPTLPSKPAEITKTAPLRQPCTFGLNLVSGQLRHVLSLSTAGTPPSSGADQRGRPLWRAGPLRPPARGRSGGRLARPSSSAESAPAQASSSRKKRRQRRAAGVGGRSAEFRF